MLNSTVKFEDVSAETIAMEDNWFKDVDQETLDNEFENEKGWQNQQTVISYVLNLMEISNGKNKFKAS